MPFAGDHDAAVAAATALSAVDAHEGDELIVVDNTFDRVFDRVAPLSGVTVVFAAEERSSYYARNVGAEKAVNDWILFIDSDCRPAPDLLERFFAASVPDGTVAIAGAVSSPDHADSSLGRFATTRRLVDQEQFLFRNFRPFAATANLLVRRAIWRDLGGFAEGIRSAGDVDFSWRLLDSGRALEYAPEASVQHSGRERLRGLIRQKARYGAGRAWLVRRYPGSCPPLRPTRTIARSLAASAVWAVRGKFDRATMRALDAIAYGAESLGYLRENREARRVVEEASASVVYADDFPGRGVGSALDRVAAIADDGSAVHVEACRRSDRPDPWLTRDVDVTYLEDDGFLRRRGALVGLALRHPVRVGREVVGPRRKELPALAPAALRLRALGAEALVVHGTPDDHESAARLARLAGARVEGGVPPRGARMTPPAPR
jgi:GT2 family glycosyltransferase